MAFEDELVQEMGSLMVCEYSSLSAATITFECLSSNDYQHVDIPYSWWLNSPTVLFTNGKDKLYSIRAFFGAF
jgi:hypothetical protein